MEGYECLLDSILEDFGSYGVYCQILIKQVILIDNISDAKLYI